MENSMYGTNPEELLNMVEPEISLSGEEMVLVDQYVEHLMSMPLNSWKAMKVKHGKQRKERLSNSKNKPGTLKVLAGRHLERQLDGNALRRRKKKLWKIEQKMGMTEDISLLPFDFAEEDSNHFDWVEYQVQQAEGKREREEDERIRKILSDPSIYPDEIAELSYLIEDM